MIDDWKFIIDSSEQDDRHVERSTSWNPFNRHVEIVDIGDRALQMIGRRARLHHFT